MRRRSVETAGSLWYVTFGLHSRNMHPRIYRSIVSNRTIISKRTIISTIASKPPVTQGGGA